MDNLKNNRDEKGKGSKTACSIDYGTLDEASAGEDSKYDSTEDDSSKESSKNSSKATSTKSCKDGSSKESSKASSTKESSKDSSTTESSKDSSAEESTKDSSANDEDGNLHLVREEDSQDESIGESIEELAEEVADAVEEEGEAEVDWPAEPHDINSPDSPADESPIHGPPAMALIVHDAASEGIIAPEDVVVFEPEVSVAVQVVHVVSVPAPIDEQQHAPIAAQHHSSSNPTGSVREQPSSSNPSVPMREQQRASSVALKPSSSNPSVPMREQQRASSVALEPSSSNPSVSVREQQPSSTNPSVPVREQPPSSANPSVSVREQPPSSANPSFVSVREQPPSSANPSVSVREHQQSSANPSVSVREHQPSSADPSVSVREQQPSSADPSGPVREQQPSLANPSVLGQKQQLVSSVAQHQSSANPGVVQVTQHAAPNKVPQASAANSTLPGREQRPSSANPSVPPREEQLASNLPLQPSSANPTVPLRDEQPSTPKPAVHTREQQRASNVAQPTSSVNPSVPEGELRQVTNVPRHPSADSLLEHQTTNPQPGTLETQPPSFIDSVSQIGEPAGVDRAPNVRSEIDEGVSGHLGAAVAVGEETLPAVIRDDENMTVHNLASEAVSRGTPALDQSELPRFPAEASPEERPLRMRNALLGAQRSLLSSAFPGSGQGRNVSSVPLRLPTLPRPLAPEPGPVQLVGFSVMGHPFLVTTPPLIYDGTPLREQTSSPGRGTGDHEASAPGTDGTTVLAAAVLCGSVAIFLLTVARYLNWR